MVLSYPSLVCIFVAFAQCFPETIDALVVNNLPTRHAAKVPQYVLDYGKYIHSICSSGTVYRV